jgi:glycosyltransferase involved in cell wall biosynthesis
MTAVHTHSASRPPYVILQLVSTGTYSGAEKVAADIAAGLCKRHFRAVYACTGDRLATRLANTGIDSHVVPSFAGLRCLYPPCALHTIMKRERVDLVHAHDVTASIAAHRASVGLGIPVISHIHNQYDWLRRPTAKKYLDRMFRNCFAVSIACSEPTRDFYLAHNRAARGERVKTFANAIAVSEAAKALWAPQPTAGKHILFIGRLVKQKRVDILLRAFACVCTTMEHTTLHLVGSGPDEPRLRALSSRMSLQDRVVFHGHQSDPWACCLRPDVFVLSSDYEGLPMVLLEAFDRYVPVIATDVGGIPGIVRHEENGFLIPRRNVGALADAIRHVLDAQPERIRKIAMSARATLVERHSISAYVARVSRLYAQVLACAACNCSDC